MVCLILPYLFNHGEIQASQIQLQVYKVIQPIKVCSLQRERGLSHGGGIVITHNLFFFFIINCILIVNCVFFIHILRSFISLSIHIFILCNLVLFAYVYSYLFQTQNTK